MSILVDDKEAAKKKNRKSALPEEATVSLRDQIPETLAKTLEDLNVGKKVQEIWRMGNANRATWLERQRDFLGDWDEFLESTAEGPFEGSSTLHIPMPLIVAKTVHARFLAALIGVDPYFVLKARREDSVDRQQLVSDTMNYAIKDWGNYQTGMDPVLDTWVWDWVTTGCGILKARWDCQYTSFVDVVTRSEVQVQYAVQDGKEVRIPKVVPKEVEEKITKKVWEGPVLDHRDNEDVLIVGGEGDPQRADAVIDSIWETASNMWTLVDRKIFRKEQTRDVINGGPDYVAGADGQYIKQTRATNNGKAALDTEGDLDRYQILEAYLRLDVDGGGINSDVVVWVHNRSGKILRATYLHRINKSGERPYFKIDFHKRKGQDYGIGIVEMMSPLSREMDALHNMRVDFGILGTMPFGFYKPTSSIDPEIISLEPGALIPVDNPQTDIYFPNLGNRTSFGFQEEAALQTMVERLTGINDLSLGVLSGNQGAARTATGARALLGESNANLDVYLRRLGGGWKQALRYLLHMLQQRIPEGLAFRVTGEAGSDYWSQVRNKGDIAGDFDFEVSSNSANSNRSIQQETANQVMQLTMNPLLIQAGVCSAGNIYEAVKNYMKTMGIKEFGRYISKPQGWQHMLSPEEEANRLLAGVPVPVTPEMDHAGFIAYFNTIYESDELLGQFSEDQTILLAQQKQKHEQMLQALKAQSAQAANSQQMQQNAVQSGAQAPPGQNPMAGAPVSGAPKGGA